MNNDSNALNAEKVMKDIAAKAESHFDCLVAVASVHVPSAQDPWFAYVTDGHDILAFAAGQSLEPVLTRLDKDISSAERDQNGTYGFVAPMVKNLTFQALGAMKGCSLNLSLTKG